MSTQEGLFLEGGLLKDSDSSVNGTEDQGKDGGGAQAGSHEGHSLKVYVHFGMIRTQSVNPR